MIPNKYIDDSVIPGGSMPNLPSFRAIQNTMGACALALGVSMTVGGTAGNIAKVEQLPRTSAQVPSDRRSVRSATISASIKFIKRVTHLTWLEISDMLNVKPRSVHNWVNGEKITVENALAVREVSTIFEDTSSYSPEVLRNSLYARVVDERTVFDLIKEKKFKEARDGLAIALQLPKAKAERAYIPISGLMADDKPAVVLTERKVIKTVKVPKLT